MRNQITDWLGWLFCELSFRGHDLQDKISSKSEDGWFYRPYQLGCWFYGLNTDAQTRKTIVEGHGGH